MSNFEMHARCSPRLQLAWPVILFTGLILLVPLTINAADPMAGQWKGTYTIPGEVETALVLKLVQASDGSWIGKVQSPADSLQYDELTRLSISGSAISFRYRPAETPAQVIFSGNYQSWTDAIKGIVIVGNYNIPVTLQRVGLHPDAAAAAAADSARAGLEEIKVVNIRHKKHFALVARGAYWLPIHVLKDDSREINDITTAEWAYGGGLRWYVIDDMAINVRGTFGGLKFDTTDQKLAQFESIGLNRDSYLQFDGWEGDITVYLGDAMFARSRFNPFLTFLVGYYDWALRASGRDSDTHAILEVPVAGKDWGFGLGLGTEYPFGQTFALEVSWIWQFVLTKDDKKWDSELFWSNTTFWSLNLGLVINFL